MGADFLGLILRLPERSDPNFEAGRQAVDVLTLDNIDSEAQLVESVTDDLPERMFHADGTVRPASLLLNLKRRLRTRIDEFEAQWPLGREWDSFRICGLHLLVTGGMSWGDSPTTLFETLRDLLDAPTVLEALDCGGELNPSNPVTVAALRSDWTDRPGLTDEAKAALEALPDTKLQTALDAGFTQYEDMWFHVLDNTRGDATRALLRELGLDDSQT